MLEYKASSYIAYQKACEFLKVAELLDEDDSTGITPTIVNAVFSCELFLKALLIWQNKSAELIRNHSIKKLFELLDKSDYEKIEKETGIFNWNKFLKEADDAFVKWRYVHENDRYLMISIFDLFRLAETLKKHYEDKYSIKEVLADD